jgi:LmbE family N-acetylglucosaminyl deacetylase
MELGTILGVWAHPDDESYLSGGIMADAVDNDGRVVVAMATRGQLGTSDPEKWSPGPLGALREKEMISAMAALGVTDLRWLDYEDGSCPLVPFEEAVAKVARIIEDVAPDTVLTFGPDGLTGHTDHMAVSKWTAAAFERCAPPGAKLYYAAVPQEWVERWADVITQYNVFEPGWPVAVPPEDLVIAFDVPEHLRALKESAIRAHASQVEGFIDEVGADRFLSLNETEWFRLGAEARSSR